jgi:hypothetical protein
VFGAGPGHARFDRREAADGEVGLGGGASARVWVDDGGELDGEAGLLQLAVDAEVVAAEDPGADDGDAERSRLSRSSGYRIRHYLTGASTA